MDNIRLHGLPTHSFSAMHFQSFITYAVHAVTQYQIDLPVTIRGASWWHDNPPNFQTWFVDSPLAMLGLLERR